MRESNLYKDLKGRFFHTAVSALWILTCSSAPGLRGWAQQLADPVVTAEIKKLSDKREALKVRESAADALGHFSPPNEATIQALTKVLQDKHEAAPVRRAAVSAMAAISGEPGGAGHAVTALVKMLSEPYLVGDPIRAAVIRALGKILQNTDRVDLLGQAVPVLVKALTKPDPDPMVRANVALVLGQIIQRSDGSRSTEASDASIVEALIEAVKITHRNVAENAAQSLIKYRASVPKLIHELDDRDSDANFRWDVAWILAQIGKDAKTAVPSLTRHLKDDSEDPNVRGCAAWAIGMIGSGTKPGTSDFLDTVSVLTDTLQNKNDDPNVRSNAAFALGRMGPEVNADNRRFRYAVPTALANALSDADPDIRRNAAWALGQIRSVPKAAVSALVTKLKDEDKDPRVRKETAEALGLIRSLGGGGETTVQALSRALTDGDPAVRMAAAVALGRIGADARTEIPQLLTASQRPRGHAKNEPDRNAAAEALAKIAEALNMKGMTDAIKELHEAEGELKKNGYRDYAEQIRRAVDSLSKSWWLNRIIGLLAWIQRYRVPAFAICAYVLVWLLLYWKSPLLTFRINEALKPYAGHKLPKFLGGLPVSYLILGGFFHYRPRVLDAWVAGYIGSARQKFRRKLTVEQREVHVELPAFLDGRAISALGAADLRSCFERKRTCVVIWGEGGAGKTSLACQICKWAMTDDHGTRLSQHPMLAVLLEAENFEIKDDENVLIEAVRRELWYLMESADAPSPELVEKLLESRRILVVVDGFSEMNDAKRSQIQPGSPNFAARALVITSRLEVNLAGIDLTVVKPMRVQGDHLSTFMDAYLVQRKKKDLFSDAEYFDDLGKLSRMVGEREITVLLAKLFAEQMIAAKEANLKGNLPENIPDLMLEYLNELNRKAMESRLDDRIVHRTAKAVAWECLRETYRPMPAQVDTVLQRMDGSNHADKKRLKNLEDSLRLVQTIGAGRDRIRFTLDPLAEYLAALQVMENFACNEQDWRTFLTKADAASGAPEAIKGFLLAVYDCCRIKGAAVGVPTFVSGELAKRAGLEKPGMRKPSNGVLIAQARSA